jgi:polyhydroxyalkanoate synthesis regulator phasin
MPENDLLRRYLDAGIAFTQMTRQRAEGIVRDLVAAGEVSREQATSRVEELVERSRQNTEALLALVRREVDDRLAQLNLVSRDDVTALIGRLAPPGRRAARAARATKATTKTAAKARTATTAAPKAAAKKAAAKKAPAKKGPAKRAPAKKAPAKKAPAKKAGA